MAKTAPQQHRGKLKAVVPKLFDMTERVLFGDVRNRAGLSKRDRSLNTVAALVALVRPHQLRKHMLRALDNGVTRTALREPVTHPTFPGGWPAAITATGIAAEVFDRKWPV